MSKYRIVKVSGYANVYAVQKKVFFNLFWFTIYDYHELKLAKFIIQDELRKEKEARENPKSVVVKEY